MTSEVKSERRKRKSNPVETPAPARRPVPLRWLFVVLTAAGTTAFCAYAVWSYSPHRHSLIRFHAVAVLTVQDEQYVVDANGRYAGENKVHSGMLLRITGVIGQPTALPGTPWGDEKVHAAARLAALLFDDWQQLGVTSIEVGRDPLEPELIYLQMRGGSRVIWGTGHSREPEAEQKLQWLREHVAAMSGGPFEFDLRYRDGIRRTQIKTQSAPQTGI